MLTTIRLYVDVTFDDQLMDADKVAEHLDNIVAFGNDGSCLSKNIEIGEFFPESVDAVGKNA